MSEKKTFTRSKSVRQRRLKRIQRQTQEPQAPKRKSRAKSRPNYRELPPIISRGVVNNYAIERRKKTGKRRFNAVLSMTRPRIRAFTFPRLKIQFGWRLLSFFLVLLFGSGLYLLWTRPEFRVNGATVTGNQRISEDEINNVLGLINFPIILLTPDSIRDQTLRNYPELASVEVTISLPNIVTVNVTERQPIILWHQESGYTWIDESGTAFRPRGEVPGLIVVQALGEPPIITTKEVDPLIPTLFISENTVKAIKALENHAPPGTPLLYDPKSGLSWMDSRGWQVVFGTSGVGIDSKILVYQAMVEWLSQRGIQPILINVAYPKAPFYRVEQIEVQEVEEQ